MDEFDKSVSRSLLKPLAHRSQNVRDQKAVLKALQSLDSRALGVDLTNRLRNVVNAEDGKNRTSWDDPARIKRHLELTQALYASRLFSTQEYVFHASLTLERLADKRAQNDSELNQINHAINKIRKKHGLKEDEDWRVGEGPEEHIHLNERWNTRYKHIELDVFREFGFSDLAELSEKSPNEFDRLRERGRRTVFHKDEYLHALRDIIVRHEKDAELASAVGAYSAAVTSLGAGVEGLLLLRCLQSKTKATRLARAIPKKNRPRFPGDPTTWSFENLIEVSFQAGWLPSLETPSVRLNSASLAHIIRLMRNQVHPGRQAKEKPWSEIDKRDFDDAIAIYITLLSTLKKDKKIWRSISQPRAS